MPVPVVHVTGTGAHDGDSGTACCGNTGQHGDILHTGSSRHHSGTARRENSGFHGGIHLLQTQTGPHRGLQPLGLPVPGPLCGKRRYFPQPFPGPSVRRIHDRLLASRP